LSAANNGATTIKLKNRTPQRKTMYILFIIYPLIVYKV
jgi:hypothetical protein